MRVSKRQVIFAAGILGLAVSLYYLANRENDPLYKDKPLSAHLATLTGAGIGWGLGSDATGRLKEPIEPDVHFTISKEVEEAISTVGTKALPLLNTLLSSRNSRLGLWFQTQTELHPRFKRFVHTPQNQTWLKQVEATAAFHELGGRALPAVPRIVKLFNEPQCVMSAIVSFISIHPTNQAQILALTNVFQIQYDLPGSPPYALDLFAILALGSFGTNASGAVPILLGKLGSTNEEIQAASAVALSRIGAPPGLAVPQILQTVPLTNASGTPVKFGPPGMTMDPSPIPTMMKIWALEKYGRHASNAVPVLSNLAQSTRSGNIQDAASEAIRVIRADMETKTR